MDSPLKPHNHTMANAGIVTRKALRAELNIDDDETLRGWERDGMPTIRRGNTIMYHVPTVVKWLLKHQRSKKQVAR